MIQHDIIWFKRSQWPERLRRPHRPNIRAKVISLVQSVVDLSTFSKGSGFVNFSKVVKRLSLVKGGSNICKGGLPKPRQIDHCVQSS